MWRMSLCFNDRRWVCGRAGWRDESMARTDLWVMSDVLPAIDQVPAVRTLSAAERERAARYRHRTRRSVWVAGRSLVRLILAKYIATNPADCEITTRCSMCGHSSHGKPRLRGHYPFDFSIAHTGRSLVVGVDRSCRIGVDVERRDRDMSKIVDEVLSPSERRLQGKAMRILDAWVRKEAIGKASGLGLALSPTRLEVAHDSGWARTVWDGETWWWIDGLALGSSHLVVGLAREQANPLRLISARPVWRMSNMKLEASGLEFECVNQFP
jgi:phosphopantetheinyl transferase